MFFKIFFWNFFQGLKIFLGIFIRGCEFKRIYILLTKLTTFFFFLLKNKYNILLTPQLEPFSRRPRSTLYMGRCQFNYKTFVTFLYISFFLISRVVLIILKVFNKSSNSPVLVFVWTNFNNPWKKKVKTGHVVCSDNVHLFTLNRVFLQGHSKSAARWLDDLLLGFIVKTYYHWAYYMLQYPKIMLA